MGRTITTHKYEITPEIKELQKLALAVRGIGVEANIDITQDLVTINGYKKYNRVDAKIELLRLLESNKTAMTTSDFPDPEVVAREEKLAAKKAKKHREPGAPPELKTVIRRAKRIYKKSIIKNITSVDASAKATKYLESKLQGEELGQAAQHLLNYIAKEMA